MLEINKNTLTENTFEGLINTLDIGEESMSELEDMSTETTKSEMQRKKKMTGKKKKRNRMSKNCEMLPKGIICIR